MHTEQVRYSPYNAYSRLIQQPERRAPPRLTSGTPCYVGEHRILMGGG